MAPQIWRDRIDFTNDSGEEMPQVPPSKPRQTPIPLPENVRHLYSSLAPTVPSARLPNTTTPVSSARNTPIPLPGNVRPLSNAPSSSNGSATPANRATPYMSPDTTASSGSSKASRAKKLEPATDRTGKGRTDRNQISFFSGNDTGNGDFSSSGWTQHAQKKRKLSGRENESGHASLLIRTREGHGSPEYLDTSFGDDGFGKFRAGYTGPRTHGFQRAQNEKIGVKPNASNGRPFLESTPMANGTKAAAFSNLPAPRTTQSGNMPVAVLQQKLGLSELEKSSSDDQSDILDTFKPRSGRFKKAEEHKEPEEFLIVSRSPLPMHEPRVIQVTRPSRLVNTPATELHYGVGSAVSIRENAPPPTAAPVGKTFTNKLTDEDHLLIFLKEVKRLKWAEITACFQTFFPARTYGQLQHHYSARLNKRDRSLDPPKLHLPSEFDAEADVDWQSVYQASGGFKMPVSRDGLSGRPSTSIHPTQRRSRREEKLAIDSNLYDNSSGNDAAPHHGSGRSRRNLRAINYALPKQHQTLQSGIDWDDGDSVMQDMVSEKASNISDDSSNSSVVFIPPHKTMDGDFDRENANLVVSGRKLPYLSRAEKNLVGRPRRGDWDQLHGRAWQGTVFHVDFSHDEQEIVCQAALKLVDSKSTSKLRSSSLRKQLRGLLGSLSEAKLLQLSHRLRSKLNRDRASIDAFLQNARHGKISRFPHVERLGPITFNQAYSSNSNTSTSALVRQRELGLQSRRGWRTSSIPLSYKMRNNVYDTLGLAYHWTGASSDIHAVAWSPDGQYFAGGAVAVTDPHSMQYNRPNNLLYGDLMQDAIHELAEHRERRPRPESGPNSTHAMHVSQDQWLYHTVSSVAFSPDGDHMFSGGYDCSAMIWRRSNDGMAPILIKSLKHKAEVDILAVNRSGVLATAAKRWKRAIKVCLISADDEIVHSTYSSRKADQRPDQKILPTALQFEPEHGRLLLTGFGANTRQDRLDTTGDICLWDIQEEKELAVHGSAMNVFDVAWVPNQIERKLFAVGCVAGQNVNRGTRSLVRLYDDRGHGKSAMNIEIECPALDMNDVVICPYDERFVAAGCTSGQTFVWDFRRPDDFLYALSHQKSLMPLDEFQDHEVTDTGVRFLSWGENATRLYTGSSDGTVKVWDIARSQQDVFIKDLATFNSGIMSGAFSPDKSRLVLGEVNGSVNVLEVGKDDYTFKDASQLRYLPYEDDFEDTDSAMAIVPTEPESGRAIASALLSSAQMMTVPFGGLPVRQAVQGRHYAGPFDCAVDAPFLREQAWEFQFKQSQTRGPECTLPSCRDAIVKTTAEEVGDSGRSADRIPDELRKQWTMLGSNLTVIPGKAKCANCGRPARPSESDAVDVDKSGALCERCHFSCFRCGGVCKLDPATSKVVCSTCFRAWDVGVLGYDCVEDTGCGVLSSGVPSLDGFASDLRQKKVLDHNASFGDDMNALTEYYFGLAIDRPASPPL